jgi:hypothetical protein
MASAAAAQVRNSRVRMGAAGRAAAGAADVSMKSQVWIVIFFPLRAARRMMARPERGGK